MGALHQPPHWDPFFMGSQGLHNTDTGLHNTDGVAHDTTMRARLYELDGEQPSFSLGGLTADLRVSQILLRCFLHEVVLSCCKVAHDIFPFSGPHNLQLIY